VSCRLKNATRPEPWCSTAPIPEPDASHSTTMSFVKSGSWSTGAIVRARCKVRNAFSEGPEKATRGGGGEWESIKIPRWNSAYVPKSTRRPSLLTRPRPHRYRKAINPQNQVRNHKNTVKDNNRCKKSQV
jgi:hypothetical protein